MKVGSVNNANFKGVLGKTEVINYHGSGIDSQRVILHVYPFKDEFVKKDELEKKANEYLNSYYDTNEIKPFGRFTQREVKIENPLPFTQAQLQYAKNYPKSPTVSKEALNFIESNCRMIVTKHTGFCRLPIV